MLVALPKTHPLGRRSVLDISELVDEPLVVLSRSFGTRQVFDHTCAAAHIRPRVLFESSSPHTIIALAATGYGLAIVPSTAPIPARGICAIPLVHRGAPIGGWSMVAWDPQRFLAPYAQNFIDELVAYSQRNYPNRDLTRRAPPFPRPEKSKTKASKGHRR